MINRRKRRDSNHAEVIEAFQRLGWTTVDCSQLGGSVPDLICARAGRTVAVEVKAPNGKLKPGQVAWLQAWPGESAVVKSYDDVVALTHVLTGPAPACAVVEFDDSESADVR